MGTAYPSKRKPTRRGQNRRGRPPLRKWLWWPIIGGLAILALVCLVYGFWASSFDINAVREMPSRSTVYDLDGKVYTRLQGENRIVVPLERVSPHFVNALLAREDARFYQHRGIDPVGVIRAIVKNFATGSRAQGASTLTQQLARNSFPEGIGQTKSIHRKLLEAFVSIRIEQKYDKKQILEAYLNRIYFGTGVYGLEAASLAYFGKHAADLDLGEAATIAGIIRAPTYASPFQHPERAQKARDAVLDRMVKVEKLDARTAEAVKAKPLVITKRKPLQAQENYVMDAVLRDLNVLLTDEQRAQGGLRIYTSIDPALQRATEQAVETQLRKVEQRAGFSGPKKSEFTDAQRDEEAQTPYLQGAAVVIDNRSGGIRALVGGRDYGESKYNRALSAPRQVGSTFKPLVYAAAFRKGLLPGAAISDGQIARGEIDGARDWTPGNSDSTYKGLLRADEGLIQSRNTMSVRVGQYAGIDEVLRLCTDIGLPNVPRQPSIYLGALESTLTLMTSAYTVLANQGVRRQVYLIERIDDAAGEMIYRSAHIETKPLDAGVAWLTTAALAKVFERGTAASAKAMGWTKPAAGKTGTTNDFKDAWFIGYTGSLTTGVWVGFDTPQTIVARGYGAALALPIWADIMNSAPNTRYPAQGFKPAMRLQSVEVCALTNELATSGCEREKLAYSIDLPANLVPDKECPEHRGNSIFSRRDDGGRSSKPGGIFRSFRRFFGGE